MNSKFSLILGYLNRALSNPAHDNGTVLLACWNGKHLLHCQCKNIFPFSHEERSSDFIGGKVRGKHASKTLKTLRSILYFEKHISVPYTSLLIIYGLTAWGQAANAHLNKLLLLQKRALRLMYFPNLRTHAIPWFISSKILPVHLLYFEAIFHSMYDVSNNSAPKEISDKFAKSSLIHSYNTRAASCGKYHIKFSRLNQQRNSLSCFGAKAWNCLPSQECSLPKPVFKNQFAKLYSQL